MQVPGRPAACGRDECKSHHTCGRSQPSAGGALWPQRKGPILRNRPWVRRQQDPMQERCTVLHHPFVPCGLTNLTDSIEVKPPPMLPASPSPRLVRPLSVRYCVGASTAGLHRDPGVLARCCGGCSRHGNCTRSLAVPCPGSPRFLFMPARGHVIVPASLSFLSA